MPTIPPERRPSERRAASGTGRWRSRSARTPSATTGPGPAIPTPWWSGSSPPVPAPTSSTSACGTGIAARQFQAAGCTVLGVEPDARMADVARRSGLEVEVATFEAWDPAGRTFDAVVAGQAWHWVDPVAGAAKAAEVLRPGGRLAVFWNVFQPPPDLAEAFAAVYRRVLPDSPIVTAGRCRGLDGYSACSPRRPTGSGRRARSANRSSGGSTGSGPTPATSGWTRCPRPAATAGSRRPARRTAGGRRRRHRRGGRQLHDALRHAGHLATRTATQRRRDGTSASTASSRRAPGRARATATYERERVADRRTHRSPPWPAAHQHVAHRVEVLLVPGHPRPTTGRPTSRSRLPIIGSVRR